MNTMTRVAEPAIISANTYFWSPDCTASGRRRNEDRQISLVANWLESLGFSVYRADGCISAIYAGASIIEVQFRYSESCKNVYKSLAVTKNGKRSNVTALRKL